MNLKVYSIFFFLGLLNLPGTTGFQLLHYFFAFVYLLLFIVAMASGSVSLLKSPQVKKVGPVLFYCLLIFVSLIRANEFSLNRLLDYLSFTLFLIAYISGILDHCKDEGIRYIDGFRNFVINPFVYYIGINYVFWLLNITSDARSDGEIFIGNAVVLQALGYSIERVNFLFSIGINGYAVILGAILSFITVDNVFQNKWTVKNIVLYIIVMIAILLTDSRSAIIYPILILAGCYAVKLLKMGFVITISPIIFVVIPLLVAFVLPLLAEVAFFAQFSRNATDLFTLNGRVFIWVFAFEEFNNFNLFHLFGFGYFGHVTSGASLKWAFLFVSYNVSDNVHPHNSILSMIFDIGYLGLATIIFIIWKVSAKLRQFWNQNVKHALTFYALLLYFIFISITESFIGFYYLNAFPLIISLFLFVLGMDTNKSEQQNITE